jgi:hypothetical protein
MVVLTLCASGLSARADEIRLKGGRKLYGVIVAYEDNMFKVKTEYGYELIEKDKIESIIPSTPAEKTGTPAASKKSATPPKTEGGAPTTSSDTAAATNANAKSAAPGKTDKTAPKMTNTAAKTEVPINSAANAAAPAGKDSATSAASVSGTTAATPVPPKEPEVPANREEVLGNLYTNYTHGFRMYKAPSWSLIEEARGALPNAIVAMGTSNESTLLVVGEEKTKEPLDIAAAAVEKRLQDVYANYQRLSQRKSMVGGLPAVEYQYRGKADEHDWSGKLVVVARGKDMFTVLAMTYADSDLIQIQENVISRAIGSLDFNVH